MKKIKIIVITHKKADMPSEDMYLPIHVGKEGKEYLGYIGDNTGDNISYKNKNFCELTGMYWYLKNRIDDDIEYIGVNHYRRYFLPCNKDFKNSSVVKMSFKDWSNVTKKNKCFLDDAMSLYDAVLPIKRIYPISIKAQYSTMHFKEHLVQTINVIKENYPQYMKATDDYMNGNKTYLYNMFLMKKEIYINMMDWVFDILFKVEKLIEIPDDKQQARVFGFLAERLINIYIIGNELNVKELPIAFINNETKIKKDKYNFNKTLSNTIFYMSNKLSDYLFYYKNIKILKSKSKS